MGFSFETLQKVLTFAHTIAEIAQLVEHQLPKLRAAGSNPVFRSKANRRMMQIIRFFVPGQDRCKLVCIRDWMGNKKGCAQHNGLLSGAPAASARECRRPNPASGENAVGQIPLHTGNPGGTPAPQQVPAIHRGHAPPPEGPPARGTAHDGTNLLHRGHTPLLQPSPAKGTAHGELHELTNAINPLRNFLLYL